MFRLLLSVFFGFALAASDPSGASSVVGRIPNKIGDSANALVGSLGGEIGSGLGTIGEGVGEIPRALGKAVGSVPGALGKGVGNIGDLGAGEARKVAKAVGDTVHGVSGIASGIMGGLLHGSGKAKREASPLEDLNLLQHANLLRTFATQASDSAIREVCKLVAVIESAASNEELRSLAPGIIQKIKEGLALVQNSVCLAVNVSGEVEQLVNGVFGKQ